MKREQERFAERVALTLVGPHSVFSYMYRDGSNYKSNVQDVILVGPWTAVQWQRLQRAFDERQFFIAEQIGVPEVFLYRMAGRATTGEDHCWHEALELRTAEPEQQPNDPRTVEEFVCDVEQASREGWKVFDPMLERP